MEAALFFITVALLSYCSTVSSLGTGAPTFLNVCHDLTQVHSPNNPTECASDCLFSVVVDSIDGNEIQAEQPSTFRCGSVYRRKHHKSRLTELIASLYSYILEIIFRHCFFSPIILFFNSALFS